MSTSQSARPADTNPAGWSRPRWARWALAVLFGVGLLFGIASTLWVPSASAHPLNTSAVLLDIGADQVAATVELPLDELSIAENQKYTATSVVAPAALSGLRRYVREHLSATDDTGQIWSTAVTGGRVEQVDGADNLVLAATLTPSSGTVGDFVLHYDAVMDQLVSHRVFVSARFGHSGSYTTLAMLSWQTTQVTVASVAPSEATGFVAAVHLGVQHISTGSDHLLFLLMLLLPAPLLAGRRQWRPRNGQGWAGVRRTALRVVHVVTAFAVGHSMTLALGALGWVSLPDRLVETGIALSVLVSAIHAMCPLVRRGEIFIGAGFGLLHGLAFAAVLGQLNLSGSGLVATLFGFNVGIELTQLLVVALVMPSLLLLSTARLYTAFRFGFATLGAVLAAGWVAQRTGILQANPLEPLGNVLINHPVLFVGVLAVLGVGTALVQRQLSSRRNSTSAVPANSAGSAGAAALGPVPDPVSI